jgi:hypothetical protein
LTDWQFPRRPRRIGDAAVKLYDPKDEIGGPGAAFEARIYWDAGTGEIDFSEPYATVPMNHPTNAHRYTWQSAPLTDGQTYRFCIRIADASHPQGVETKNTDCYIAMAEKGAPVAPVLSAHTV